MKYLECEKIQFITKTKILLLEKYMYKLSPEIAINNYFIFHRFHQLFITILPHMVNKCSLFLDIPPESLFSPKVWAGH